jgi:hypothetical protein
MPSLTQSAYFLPCQCRSPAPHGIIHCPSGLKIQCFDKLDARDALDLLVHHKVITAEERTAVRAQIDESLLPLQSDEPISYMVQVSPEDEEDPQVGIGLDGLSAMLDNLDQATTFVRKGAA